MRNIIAILLVLYLLFVGLYISGFLYVVRNSKKNNFLRKLFSFLYSIKNLGTEGIIYQSGFHGCGKAALSMLFDRTDMKNALLESGAIDELPMDMFSISVFIRGAGLDAAGYEFTGISQLDHFVKANPDTEVMLLMNRYDGINQPSIMTFVLFPIVAFIEISERLKKDAVPELHWVMLDEISDDGVILSDPFLGRIKLSEKRINKCWSNYGLVVDRKNIHDNNRQHIKNI